MSASFRICKVMQEFSKVFVGTWSVDGSDRMPMTIAEDTCQAISTQISLPFTECGPACLQWLGNYLLIILSSSNSCRLDGNGKLGCNLRSTLFTWPLIVLFWGYAVCFLFAISLCYFISVAVLCFVVFVVLNKMFCVCSVQCVADLLYGLMCNHMRFQSWHLFGNQCNLWPGRVTARKDFLIFMVCLQPFHFFRGNSLRWEEMNVIAAGDDFAFICSSISSVWFCLSGWAAESGWPCSQGASGFAWFIIHCMWSNFGT